MHLDGRCEDHRGLDNAVSDAQPDPAYIAQPILLQVTDGLAVRTDQGGDVLSAYVLLQKRGSPFVGRFDQPSAIETDGPDR